GRHPQRSKCRQCLRLAAHRQVTAADLIVQDWVIGRERGSREQRLKSLRRAVRETVGEGHQLVDVGTTRVELDGSTKLANGVVESIAIEVHGAKCDMRVNVEHAAKRLLQTTNSLIPTPQGPCDPINVVA